MLDVKAPTQPGVRFTHCDLSQPAKIDAVVSTLPPTIDALVNVAGIPGPEPSETVMAVNFFALRHLTESLVDRIADGGSIVNVASCAGRDWQKREDVIQEVLDTPDFAAGLAWLRQNSDAWSANPYKFSKQCGRLRTRRAVGDCPRRARNPPQPKHN